MDTDILNKAKYYCARAERSPRNLRLFLMRREVPSDEIDEYLVLLQEGRYYDRSATPRATPAHAIET